jgi:hypothetical protein
MRPGVGDDPSEVDSVYLLEEKGKKLDDKRHGGLFE